VSLFWINFVVDYREQLLATAARLAIEGEP
jgi:hypothetical protein